MQRLFMFRQRFLVLKIMMVFCVFTSMHISSNAQDTTASSYIKHNASNTNPYAMVAGGSKGIGYAIAEALAKRHYNLILIARHADSLNATKGKLETLYKVHIDIIVMDLSKTESANELAAWCTERQIRLKILCNVAGFGGDRDYLTLPLDTLRYMMKLNFESPVALCYTLLPLLEKNAPSYILNVASMAGLAPIPIKNLYASTKSALVFFSYSLRYQLKSKHISVSCLCPGPVFTKPLIRETTIKELGWFGKKMAVTPKRVGEIAVKKMLKRHMIIVPGTISKIISGILRVMPRRLSTSIYYQLGKSNDE